MKKLCLFPLILILVIIVVPACEKEKELAIPVVHFDEYEDYLLSNVAPKCVGMQYCFSQNGQLVLNNATGKSRLPANGGNISFHPLQRKSLHSVSKTITAMAMLFELTYRNVDVHSPVLPFLPSDWNIDPDLRIMNPTFHQLLTHTSGLKGTLDSYSAMKKYIAEDVLLDTVKNWDYQNVNYTLMRILINNIGPGFRATNDAYLQQNGETEFARYLAEGYVTRVALRLEGDAKLPAAISPKVWDSAEFPVPVYMYDFANLSTPGYVHTDQTLFCGAGGWYMNSKELNQFLSYLVQDQIPHVSWNVMKTNEYGCYEKEKKGIKYYTHNGASGSRADNCGGRSVWVYFPDKEVIVSIQINSSNNAFTMAELEDMVVDGYIASYHG